jgi:hypothetical protein
MPHEPFGLDRRRFALVVAGPLRSRRFLNPADAHSLSELRVSVRERIELFYERYSNHDFDATRSTCYFS